MRRLTTSTARREFAELVNKAHYGEEVTVITRRGKDLAAVVPMKFIDSEVKPNATKKKPPARST